MVAGRRVLLVEDDRVLALVTQRHLEQLGYLVEVVHDGDAALAAANRERPALVLMDIVLAEHGPDGVETAGRLLERHDVPVVYLTSCSDDETVARASATEAHGYIVKPIERPQLRSAIEMALGRHRAERRLRRTKELLWTTLRGIHDGVITTDRLARVVMLNEAAEELTGLSVQQAVGKPLGAVLKLDPPEEHAQLVAGLDRVLAGEEMLSMPRTTLRQPGQGSRDIDLQVAAIEDEAGDLSLVLVLRDIEEQLRSEAELIRHHKLESIGRLAGGLAHDFNNLLMAILSNVALARLQGGDDGEISELLGGAEQAAQRATALTRQLLLFSDGSAPQKRPLELSALLRHQTQLSLHRSLVSARFEIDSDLWCVEADEPQLNQLIHSLVINARDAMSRGGPLQARAANLELLAPSAELPAGRYVCLEIEDFGHVLSEHELAHVFDPYARSSRRESGLWLAAAQSIAHNHGGDLTARARDDGQGMVFSARLPATEQPAARSVAWDVGAAAGVAGDGYILLMDDEEMICSSVGRLLARLGYRYETVSDGAAALECYRDAARRDEPFDAVILDWTVPGGLGGEETLAALRALDPEVRAILATGYAAGSHELDFAGIGFRHVLFKPYTIGELSAALAEMLADK